MPRGKLAKDLSGQEFGRLTVLRRAESTASFRARWLCLCRCGTECTIIGAHLKSGETKSCGCYKREALWNTTHGHSAGGKNTRVYAIWLNMKYRCDVTRGPRFKDYGGRGITYDPRWKSFETFLADMGEPPVGTSLDRTDNDGPYSKENCRWADRKTQRRNSRAQLTWLEIDGERMILTDAVKRFGKVGYLAAIIRIGKGWNPVDAVLTPPYGKKPA